MYIYLTKSLYHFYIIRKLVFHPPVNIITELSHTFTGLNILYNNNYINDLMAYCGNNSTSNKEKKAIFWILAKILTSSNAVKINKKYNIINYINSCFVNSEDFGIKGNICYIFSYISIVGELKRHIANLGWNFFHNNNIAFPSNMDNLCRLNKKATNCTYSNDYVTTYSLNKINSFVVSNKKSLFNNELKSYESNCSLSNSNLVKVNSYSKNNYYYKINNYDVNQKLKVFYKYTKLNLENEEYYNQFCLLLNIITSSQAYNKLKDIYKNNSYVFSNPNLLARVITLLSKYKYQHQIRIFIFSIIEPCLNNVVIMEKVVNLINKLCDNIF